MDIVLQPVRVATSKPARQTYLNTILFLATCTVLGGLAIIAYVLFYLNYVPQIGIERIIHLQYGDGPHPYGIAKLDSSLVSQQPYDITLSLSLPRSPSNLEAGNFMLSLFFVSPTYTAPNPLSTAPSPLAPAFSSLIPPESIIYTSRRPAHLTYTSRLISLSERLASLPLYILGLKTESEALTIPMAESLSFGKGSKKVPETIFLELQAGQPVQVNYVRILITARFVGLRWLMYNHRIISFLVFTSAFWCAEVLFTIVGWLAIRSIFPGSTKKGKSEVAVKGEETDASTVGIKHEATETDEPDLSDTPRTFPTYGRQVPLKYERKVKDEDSEEYIMDDTTIQPLDAMADDESEELKGFGGAGRAGRSDSGLGTSFSEGGERAGLARRRSGHGRGGA